MPMFQNIHSFSFSNMNHTKNDTNTDLEKTTRSPNFYLPIPIDESDATTKTDGKYFRLDILPNIQFIN